MKLRRLECSDKDGRPLGVRWFFYCPGCKELRSYQTDAPSGPNWTFNGDQERPTFSPSLRLFTRLPRKGPDGKNLFDQPWDQERTLCHLFLTDGRLQFCGDSPHALAGQTVDLPDIPEGKAV